ncbi:hypothetical protein [Microbacterium sp. NPDC055683]
MPLSVHPVADLLPAMSEDELAELTHDIEVHGQREPAIVLRSADGTRALLDGRHRALACEALGIELTTRDVELSDDEARALVLSLNLHRRHLTASQRALIAARLAADSRQGRKPAALPVCAMTQPEAAAALGVSSRLVRDAVAVVRGDDQELVERVASGEVTVTEAAAEHRRERTAGQAASAIYLTHRRTSASDEWLTPAHIVERVVACLGGVDLDPAADPEHSVPAARHVTAVDDGLAQANWANEDGSPSSVFLNPPFNGGSNDGPSTWTRRLVTEWEAGHVSRALLLVPHRPGSQWQAELARFPRVEVRDRQAFVPGATNPARVRWERGTAERKNMLAQFATIILGIGVSPAQLAEHFGDLGTVMVRYAGG